MCGQSLTVGQVAKRTGISVRTLHYYDEVGLLPPAMRSSAGYRLYSPQDIARLQQIRSLQHLGLSLIEVEECLARPDSSLLKILELQLSQLGEQMEMQRRLRRRLEALAANLRSAEEVSVEDLLQIMEGMKKMDMHDKYFSAEQQEFLQQRRATVGDERIREAETTSWPNLIEDVRAAVDGGMDPASPEARDLADRWLALVREFTGGDPGVERSLANMYNSEQPKDIHPSMDPRMGDYMQFIGKARQASQP